MQHVYNVAGFEGVICLHATSERSGSQLQCPFLMPGCGYASRWQGLHHVVVDALKRGKDLVRTSRVSTSLSVARAWRGPRACQHPREYQLFGQECLLTSQFGPGFGKTTPTGNESKGAPLLVGSPTRDGGGTQWNQRVPPLSAGNPA